MPLIDENNRPIPLCNIHDVDSDTRFYVKDMEYYKKHTNAMQQSRTIAMLAVLMLVLFLCIFTLNFGSSGWTAGNMLTFGIVIVTLLATAQYGKKWNESYSLVTRLQSDGVPCYTGSEAAQMVHCNR